MAGGCRPDLVGGNDGAAAGRGLGRPLSKRLMPSPATGRSSPTEIQASAAHPVLMNSVQIVSPSSPRPPGPTITADGAAASAVPGGRGRPAPPPPPPAAHH